MIIENADDRFNQSNISFGDESYINNFIDNDIDVNEDEMLALYFRQKPEEINPKIHDISEEIEKTDKKISFKDNCDIDYSNITKDRIQNISEELEKEPQKINTKDNSEIDESNTTKDRSSKSIKISQKEKSQIKIIKNKDGKIFNIVKMKKINKKKGRLLKNAKKRYFCGCHDKFKEDNVIKKIKISFIFFFLGE